MQALILFASGAAVCAPLAVAVGYKIGRASATIDHACETLSFEGLSRQ